MRNDAILSKINVVVDKLINLGGADYESDKKQSLEEIIKTGNCSRDFGIEEWDWPQGVGLYGIYKLQEFYGDDRYMNFFAKWFRRNIEVGLPSRNINTTAPYLTLVCILDRMPDKGFYEKLCIDQANWLLNELPKTKENGFQHVTTGIGDRNAVIFNESQLWLDTIFMTLLFLCKMAKRHNNAAWKKEAEYQMMLHIKYLYNKQNGLFYHGWSFDRNDNFGGVFWCRGNSWFTLGAIDFISFNTDIPESVKGYVLSVFRAQVDRLMSLQQASGLWTTILDDSTTYEEASGSAAITAGILNAVKYGFLEHSYLHCAEKALAGLMNCIASDGTVQKVSAGTAMGMNPEHYKNIQIRPMAYGQALALIALVEALHG